MTPITVTIIIGAVLALANGLLLLLVNRMLIKATARSSEGFYYLMHPPDLADWERDLDPAFRERYSSELALFERLRVPFVRKQELFRAAFETLAELGEFTTLEKIAREQIKKLTA